MLSFVLTTVMVTRHSIPERGVTVYVLFPGPYIGYIKPYPHFSQT
ncbi:hypothetical protein HanXRQr2_Chr05g0213791 [Helianthus annuus]|uniref:Uncharacterized protein n=1 Tax=Helianthus annuus TaxID=4232 RepID=A0A9K3NN14_HELAN|nr:hypothetical protein HanXRQr2_Chr05g0213791 [Helianthus annuus]